MTSSLRLLMSATAIGLAAPLPAQDPVAAPETAVAVPAEEKAVEGATPDRVAQVERCQGHKFETMIVIDPVKKRSTRIKLCADPGATDADWVKTLESAIVQLEQRNMPPEARDKAIGELRLEIARFAPAPKPAAAAPAASLFGGGLSPGGLIEPTERFETSKVPPLPPPLPRRVAGAASAATAVKPARAMSLRLKCIARGEVGAAGTCDYLGRNTLLVIQAGEGLGEGGSLRFRRRGDVRGEIDLAPMKAGQSIRAALPGELCRGVATSKVEIELLGPQSAGAVSARFGPYGLRC